MRRAKRARDLESDDLPGAKRIKTKEVDTPPTPWLYLENIIPPETHTRLLSAFIDATKDLNQREGSLMGKKYLEPRLSRLFTSDGHTYTYSGITHTSSRMDTVPELPELVELVQKAMKEHGCESVEFNTALMNHYRADTPNDGVMKHQDKDGLAYTIASVSLGGERLFRIYSAKTKKRVHEFMIQPRSVLLMFPGMQENYKHEVVKPKETPKKYQRDSLAEARINVTLRRQ